MTPRCVEAPFLFTAVAWCLALASRRLPQEVLSKHRPDESLRALFVGPSFDPSSISSSQAATLSGPAASCDLGHMYIPGLSLLGNGGQAMAGAYFI